MKAPNYELSKDWHEQRLYSESAKQAIDDLDDSNQFSEDDESDEDEALERWQLTDLCELLRQQSNRLEQEVAHQHTYITAIGIIALAAFIIAIAK